MSTIFVQIASYRDAQLLPTLRDCVAKAEHPDRLRFGICWQHDGTESLAEFTSDPRFRVIEVDYREAQGTCWARDKVQRLYEDEDYTLQIDSHHRFVENWDSELIAMLKAVPRPKPLLTSYAPSFNPQTGAMDDKPYALKFTRFFNEGALSIYPVTIDNWAELTEPVPARFFSAHFAFTYGFFCREVPYDPNYYFLGEESNMAVRAFTHGYDLFHPHRMILWHEYTRDHSPKHWEDHTPEKGATVPWWERNDESFRRNRILFGMENDELDIGPYGFGNVRSLKDYERYAGINFRLRLAHPDTYFNRPPPTPDVFVTDEEWFNGCLKNFWTSIRVPAEHVDRDTDYDFWYVGVHNEHDQELYRQDLGADDLALVLEKPRAEFIFFYRSQFKAHSWTVWPHSGTRGWLEKITRPIKP